MTKNIWKNWTQNLRKKFEYLESEEIEELADLEEVLLAIVEAKKIAYDDFEKIRLDKTQKRGAFKDKIFLISVEENKI